jgi:TubC N-terminal docking domain
MTSLDLLQQLQTLEVVLTPYPDGTLRYKAPKGTLTPELLDGMRQHKAELHDLVEAFEERAGVAEYCGVLSRPEVEQLAWPCVLGEPPGQPLRTAVLA